MKNSNTYAKHLASAIFLSHLLDSKFRLFGISFGVDPFFDFMPFGFTISTFLSGYILWIAWYHGATNTILIRMLLNILFDAFVSSIPYAGFIADIFIRSNEANVKILKNLAKQPQEGTVM